jgi:Gas vesicle protein K
VKKKQRRKAFHAVGKITRSRRRTARLRKATARLRKATARRRTRAIRRTRRIQPTSRNKRTVRTQRAEPALRWNPDPEDVQRSVVKLVLSLVEFIRKLMERQAIRRVEAKTLTPREIENVGIALMKLEQTVYLIAKRFKLDPKDLNLDLGPVGRLH